MDETERSATIDLTLDITDRKHLDRVVAALKRINGVRGIERALKV